MSTNRIHNVALAEFEKASNEASDLAERIGKCGRADANMVELLKAWQVARHEARSSHERLLTRDRANFSIDSNRMARAN